MKELENKIALVTGASRGIGKGIAIALAKNGAIVYITGRTEANNHKTTKLSGSIYETEKSIISLGGKCKAIRCDHTKDREVMSVFNQILETHNRIDILVNSVWGGYEYFNDGTEFWLEEGFWESPVSRWDKMFSSGVRAGYFASLQAARIMVKQKSGLIFNLSFWAAQRNDKGMRNNAGATALDVVAAPFDDVKNIYDLLGGSMAPLGLKLDYDRIKATRPEIAEMLRKD